jgi:hypothetical protein
MATIINFNKARKAKQRADAERQAAENRVKFGRTKAQKQLGAAEAEALFHRDGGGGFDPFIVGLINLTGAQPEAPR